MRKTRCDVNYFELNEKKQMMEEKNMKKVDNVIEKIPERDYG